MSKKNNQNQPAAANNATDTEFGAELTQSKKERKQAARDQKKNNS
ncbi:hypothetical protein [Bacillus sp. 2205SS5-2]